MSKPLYVFDMDETLINADCAMIWNEFLVEKGIVTDPSFLEEDQRLMALYAKGEMDMEDYIQFSMTPLAELTTSQVDALAKECVEKYILPKQFKQSKTLIAELNKDGVEMVIISASVAFLVKAVGERLSINHSLGIDLVEQSGCYSAEISGVPSYREGKVTRLKEWLQQQPSDYSQIHFFTDSINDLPLCQEADFAYLVNPCPLLKPYGEQKNWTILEWD